MTEQRAVQKLAEFVDEWGGVFRECEEGEVSDCHYFRESLIVGRQDGSVTFLYFGEIPGKPPEEALRAFTRLEKIIIRVARGRPLTWLKQIPSVKSLEIFQWEGEVFPDVWEGEKDVERLYLETKTGKVPNFVRSMKKLREIGLDSAPGVCLELPDWLPHLVDLERVYLRNCTLKGIPEGLWRNAKLPFLADNENSSERGIYLSGASLDNPDIDISLYCLSGIPKEDERRERILQNYYKKLRTQSFGSKEEPNSECMVIFLGDGSVGKSSLIDRLVDRASPFVAGAFSPTNGVKMQTWRTCFGLESDAHGDKKPLNLRLMDFGGQEIMHSIHRCFMTDNTVYVVVCESRMDSEIDVNAVRWLETVKTFAPRSRVILALNKVDLNENVSVNEKDLMSRYPSLKRILKTTAQSDPEYAQKYPLDRLEEAIKEQAKECDSAYRAGTDWLAVKHELENLRNRRDGDAWGYITEEQYKAICVRNHVTDPEDQRDMLSWFRDLAVVYSYEENADGEIDVDLQGVRVLDPQWLSNGIYRIILRAPINAVLSNDAIRKTLEHVYPDDLTETTYKTRPRVVKNESSGKEETLVFDEPEYILHVMRKYYLSHKADPEGKTEMIPSRFTKSPPSLADDFPFEDSLHLRWEGKYLPNNLVHRLMIKRFDQLQRDCMWRTGALFFAKEDGTPGARDDFAYQALVQMNDEGLDLYVATSPRLDAGNMDPRRYLWEMRMEITGIMKKMDLRPDEYPCYRLPELKSKEVKMQRNALLQNICLSTSPGQLTVVAPYTLVSEDDRKRQRFGETVVAYDMLENMYLDHEIMVRDYRRRMRNNFPRKSNASAGKAVKPVGWIESRLEQRLEQWKERNALIRYAMNAWRDSGFLALFTVIVIVTVLLSAVTIGRLPGG